MTVVDRATRCILGWQVDSSPSWDVLQAMVDDSHPAEHYFSDAFPTYEGLVYYPASHAVSDGKRDTYSVEAVNSDLRHYLARLGRKSKCFSRSTAALERAVKRFVYCYNQRQLRRRRFPKYTYHLIDFV